jgi:hypothetical protein
VLYICRVIGFARRPRRRAAAFAALVVLAAFLGLGSAGCGSSQDGPATGGTTTDGTTADTPPAGGNGGEAGSAGGGTAPAPAGDGQGSPQGGDVAAAGGQPASDGHSATGDPIRKQLKHPSEGDGKGAVSGHKVSKACPSSASRSQCEALVAGYEQSKSAPSYTVTEPEDCLKTMSRGECEVLLTAQKAAAESGTSVDVQECLRNPTPTCEAIVRPLLEQQRAAEEAAK